MLLCQYKFGDNFFTRLSGRRGKVRVEEKKAQIRAESRGSSVDQRINKKGRQSANSRWR